jgi:pyruvate dehydrogenase E1 component beta subunit
VGIDQIINNAAKMRQMTGGQFNVPIVFVEQLRQDN